MRTLWILGLALAASACASTPTPIVMVGPAQEISALAGEWSGEYRSDAVQRSGTIWFKLEAASDSAFGDVLMIPRDRGTAMLEPSAPGAWKDRPQVLTIKFVRVDGQRVTGAIDPYPSPDDGAMLFTIFRGQLKGDRVEGEFVILDAARNRLPQEGTWWAKRTVQPAR